MHEPVHHAKKCAVLGDLTAHSHRPQDPSDNQENLF